MPISGSDPALMYARLGVMRLGASRLQYAQLIASGSVTIAIAGIDQRVRRGSLTVRDLLNATPNTCSFTVEDVAPTVGQAVEIRMGLGTVYDSVLFAGSVTHVSESYEGKPDQLMWDVNCQDHTRTINRRKVRKRYSQQSATDIALDLIANYASGFTTDGVAAGLPTVSGGIDYTEEDVLTCLTRLASRVGGYTDVDYEKDVRLFLTEVTDAPDPLEAGYRFQDDPPIRAETDVSQVRNRVFVEGGGTTALSAVVAGETILPIAEPVWFEDTGGTVVSGPQRIDYTGVTEGGTGGLVGPGAAPSSGPALAQAAGSGVESGVHGYAATFTTAAGESIPGPTVSITVGTVDAPSSAPSGTTSSGGSVTAGDHTYAYTSVTATGETTPSPLSATITTGGTATAPPATGPTAGTPTAGGSVTSGDHYYAVTNVSASGESAPGPNSSTITAGNPTAYVTPPSAPSVDAHTSAFSQSFFGIGSTVSVKVTYVNASGETTGSSSSSTVTIEDMGGGIARTLRIGLTASADPTVTGIRVYYTHSGGNSGKDTNGPGTGGVYANTTQTIDAPGTIAAGSPPVSNTAVSTRGNTVPLTNIPTGPSGTTSRKIYRTAAGGSQLKLLTTIANNTSTTFSDTIADGSLGANAPTGSTLNTVNLAGIAVGNAAVTSRKIYRTEAGGSQLKLLATLADNTTTVYTDTTADGSLGANVPTSNTATANRVSVASIPLGGATVTGRKLYRTAAGGSQLKLLATLADNTTTTYADSTADGSLGANAPSADTSGLSQPAGQVSAGSVTLIVANSAGFTSAGGWAVIGNGQQVIRYTGKTGSTLTGIPASGPGSIVASIAYNSSVTQAPALIGIPASGDGAILYDIPNGQDVNLFVQRDDVAAQADLAAMEGGGSDGIYEHSIQDRRLSFEEAQAVADAELALFAYPIVTIRYSTRDPKTRSGKTIHVDLPELDLLGDYTIQSVTIDQIGIARGVFPRYTVEASSVRFSMEDMLRRVQLAA